VDTLDLSIDYYTVVGDRFRHTHVDGAVQHFASLMKDLLADVQVDDGDTGAGWLSLEQLEQELTHLDTNVVYDSVRWAAAVADCEHRLYG
jgi:hypothetical protein